MNEQIDQARKAGYSESEITNYLVQKHPEYAESFKKAKEAGYSDNEVLSYFQDKMAATKQQQAQQLQQQEQPNDPNAVARGAAQVPLGLAEGTNAGLIASGLNFFGTGEAINGYYELEERLPELKKKFPHLNWPDEIDKEKYMEAVRDASESFPTVSNISRMIEEKTGVPLTPKSDLDKGIRLIANMSKFKEGTFPEKIMAGVKAEVMKESLEHLGIPEPAAEVGGIYFGLHTPTPEGFKLPKESAKTKVSPEQPPPGEPPAAPPGTPPPTEPPPPGGIAPGSTLPQTSGTYKTKEKAIDVLQNPENPISVAEKFFNRELTPIQARPLNRSEDLFKTRVTKESKDMGLRPVPPPTGRQNAKAVEDEIGDIFSKKEFRNTSQGGEAIMKEVREQSEALYKEVNDAYEISRDKNKYVEDIHPELVKQLEEFAEPLRKINPKVRSSPQNSALAAVDGLIDQLATRVEGDITGYLDVSNQILIDSIQSLRQKIDHDFMQGVPSNVFRRPINLISDALEKTAVEWPEALEALKTARDLRRKWGETFDNPYIRPLRDPQNKDYSKTFKGALDLDEFNQLRPILNSTPKGQELERGIARDLVKKKISPLVDAEGQINPRKLTTELRELESFITPEQVNEIENIVQRRNEPDISKLKGKIKRNTEKSTTFTKPEDIDAAFKTKSGIRKLHKELKEAGKEDLFEKLAEDKAIEIFKEGKFGEQKLTGQSIAETIEKNHEVLEEILGEQDLNVLYSESKALAEKEANKDWAVNIGKKLIKRSLPYSLITKILKVFI